MSARMKVEDGAGLGSEVYDGMSLQHLQNHHLIFHQSRQCHGLSRFFAKARKIVTGNNENVKALPQALPQDEQLDSRRITHRRRLLMNEAVQHESLQMAIDCRFG